ncbi:MAG: hypothetical protein GC136_10440 [Alphaproteobacteria bacterium]|nr:hypothetical protein [Alphaproteobacteria bacterium]
MAGKIIIEAAGRSKWSGGRITALAGLTGFFWGGPVWAALAAGTSFTAVQLGKCFKHAVAPSVKSGNITFEASRPF